jgi:cholesterol oxidase
MLDYLVIGSGFGGSVAALRLAERGYQVAVLEQGRRVTPADMEAADESLRRLFWMPAMGWHGFFTQAIFRHIGIVHGVGVGGGSLVYAGVLLEPPDAFYADPAWSSLGVNWREALQPHLQTAFRMLGGAPNPFEGHMDRQLQRLADQMGAGDTFDTVPLGIFFGQPGVTVSDPYFDGVGPERTGCRHCGRCLTGCQYDAKNSLDKNYLHLAERLGARVLPEHKVTLIRPRPRAGYIVEAVNPVTRRRHDPLCARHVVVSAGVLGTLRLLFHCRDVAGTLPGLSPRLGQQVRTNSEAIVGIQADEAGEDLTEDGPTITSHFYPDPVTHITQNRFPPGYDYMRFYMGPLTDGSVPTRRALRTLAGLVRRPRESTSAWRRRHWHRRTTILTVMQSEDNQLAFRYGRSPLSGFRRDLISHLAGSRRPPAYLPVANRAARVYASATGGLPLNVLPESVFNLSVTAHVLGGCAMGGALEDGVIDVGHQVFGYPGLFVLDGSAVSANVGVNPSLTIAALAERWAAAIPAVR